VPGVTRLCVVGATGRTGRDVVVEAASRGIEVRAFARSVRQQGLPPGAVAVPGDATRPDDVLRALDGVDAVIVALSMVRTSDNPWARITTPRDLHRRAADALVAGARSAGVRRYVAVSAQGVGPSWWRAGYAFLALVHASNVGVAYRDLARAERILAASDLDWTVVRPTRLTNAPAGPVRSGPDLVTWSTSSVPRASVARFLVDCATSEDGSRQALTVTT
jgi:uncharacterized protein YbjT (DUF2867 family)